MNFGKNKPKLCLELPSSVQRLRLASRFGRSETFRAVGNLRCHFLTLSPVRAATRVARARNVPKLCLEPRVFGATTPVRVAVRKVGNLPSRWKPACAERNCVATSLPCRPSARLRALRGMLRARSLAFSLARASRARLNFRAPEFLYCNNASGWVKSEASFRRVIFISFGAGLPL